MPNENCPFKVYEPSPVDAPVIFSVCEINDPKRLVAEIAKLLFEYTEKERELEVLREKLKQAFMLYIETEKVAMNNSNNYLGDACAELVSRLDGLREFAKEWPLDEL